MPRTDIEKQLKYPIYDKPCPITTFSDSQRIRAMTDPTHKEQDAPPLEPADVPTLHSYPKTLHLRALPFMIRFCLFVFALCRVVRTALAELHNDFFLDGAAG